MQLTVDTNSPLIGGGQAKNEMPGRRSGMLAACIFPGAAAFGLAFWLFRKRHAVLRVLTLLAVLAGTTLMMNGCGGLNVTIPCGGNRDLLAAAPRHGACLAAAGPAVGHSARARAGAVLSKPTAPAS